MLGKQGKANKCPRCKTTIEKVSGCMHMTCPICNHEWCWTCGCDYKSIVHYLQLGGFGCELIGEISFLKMNCCLKAFLMTLLFVFWPIVILFMSLALGFILFLECRCFPKGIQCFFATIVSTTKILKPSKS
jgi:hypothetical protein